MEDEKTKLINFHSTLKTAFFKLIGLNKSALIAVDIDEKINKFYFRLGKGCQPFPGD